MKVELRRLNEACHLQATNETGNTIDLDGSPAIGGENLGFRPMQLLLAALGGCSTIDIITILRKQKQPLRDIRVTVDGEREPHAEPSLFQTIHVHFTLIGEVDEEKARKAIDLSMEKYCSVARILEKTAQITYSFSVVREMIPS